MDDACVEMTSEEAIYEYLDSLIDCTGSTIGTYEDQLTPFRQWCETVGITSMSEVTERHLYQYRTWRAEQIQKVTLSKEIGTFNRFLRYCDDIGTVTEGISEVLDWITLTDEEKANETMLPAGRAGTIRSYLHGNPFGSFQQVIFEILWHTTIRLGTIRALDIGDFQVNRSRGATAESAEVECYFDLVHRPESDTPLKNDADSEREINLSPEIAEVIDGWLKLNHPMVEDDFGRMPLIGTSYGRASKSAIRGNMYRLTRPCDYSDTCPHDRDLSCNARKSKQASKCPSSVSPHPIRKGSITHHRNRGWPPDAVSKRADVSREVLETHYDMGSKSEKRMRRDKFLDLL